MGYSEESKAYWLFDIIKQQIIIRRNLWFDEKYYGIKLLNSYSGLLHNDHFDVVSEFGSPIPFSVLWLDTWIMFLFKLECQPMIRLVCRYLFWLVLHLLPLKLFLLLIDLLQWISIHPFVAYPDGMLKLLNLLVLMSVIFLQAVKLAVRISMSMFLWWLMFLRLVILLPT